MSSERAGFTAAASGRLTIDGPDALNEGAQRLFLACRHRILVRAPRLDLDFYFSESFTRCCESIVVRDRRSALQFLVEDERFFMQVNSRPVALARRFSSYVGIRVIPKEYIEGREMFIIRDDLAWLHQPSMEHPRGFLDIADRGGVRQLTLRFRELWDRSGPPAELFVTGL